MSSNSEDSSVTSLREIKNPQGSLHFLLSTHVSPATHKIAPFLFQKNKTKQEKKQHNTPERTIEDPGLLPWERAFELSNLPSSPDTGKEKGKPWEQAAGYAIQVQYKELSIHTHWLTREERKCTVWRMLIFQRSGFVCILSKSYSYGNKEMIHLQFFKDTPLTSHLEK